MTRQTEQVELALELLTDPAAIDEALATARAEAGRQVAEAHAQIAEARQDASRARREAERAGAEGEEAAEAADAAARELELAESRAIDADAARGEAMAETQRVMEAAEQERVTHSETLVQVERDAAARLAAEVLAVRAELQEQLTAARAQHDEELMVVRGELADAQSVIAATQRALDAEKARREAAREAAEQARVEHADALQRTEEQATARLEAAVTAAREVLQARLDSADERLAGERDRVMSLREDLAETRRERNAWREAAGRVGATSAEPSPSPPSTDTA